MKIAELTNITFTYEGEHASVLRDLDFELHAGEHVVLMGSNGSGKSTLLRLVAGLLSPNSGRVKLFDNLCFDDDGGVRAREYSDARRSIACVFQDPSDQLVSDCVAGDIAFGPQNFCFDVEEIDDIVATELEKAGIGALADRDATTLSGGEQQLVAIASAIAMKPKLLALDEPSAYLDAEHCSKLQRLIEKASQGIAVLHVTHDSAYLNSADRVVNIEEINR